MDIHIFNPEHDLALAADIEGYVAPHAARDLQADLGFIPALWAKDGDAVLVDHVDAALDSVRHLRSYAKDVVFITMDDLKKLSLDVDRINFIPWGWDKAVKKTLLGINTDFARFLPTDFQLSKIKELSSRKYASEYILHNLLNIDKHMVGASHVFDGNADVLSAQIERCHSKVVLKSPWSSSGRGVKYVDSKLDKGLKGWVNNVVQKQGFLMVEPYYNKVKDFGMEFMANKDGSVSYSGLSLFETSHGAYTGNILAAEEIKYKELERYLSDDLLSSVKSGIISILDGVFKDIYEGPFGIDMMVVASDEGCDFLLHPCVEMNLRRTMGHVALSVSPSIYEPRSLMRITYTNKFHFRIVPLMDDLLNTSII